MNVNALTNELLKYKDTNKSLLFLYPLLFFHESVPDPIETYMGFRDYNENKHSLVCLYHLEHPRFKEINRTYREHKKFQKSFIENGYIYYIMDFSSMKHTYNAVKLGTYATIKNNVKRAISIQKRIALIHDIGLYPHKYEKRLIEEFKIQNGVEIRKNILDPPNPNNEYITLPSKFLDRVLL